MTGYKSTPLYGGALVCDLPDNFADVRHVIHTVDDSLYVSHDPSRLTLSSKIREVPDNQEVYIDQDGFTTIIFDITERVGSPGSNAEIDGRALTTHLEEIVGSEIDTVKVWNSTETQFSRLG